MARPRTDGLDLYYRDAGRVPLLTRAEERQLLAAAQQGDRAARDRLILANLRLVVAIASRYQGRGLELEDLVGAGNLGLFETIAHWDLGRPGKFSTYASYWIKEAIHEALSHEAHTIRLPTWATWELHCCRRQGRELADELGREPTDAEVIAAYKGKGKRLETLLRAARLTVVSGRWQDRDAPRSRNGEPVSTGPALGQAIEDRDNQRAALAALNRLDPVAAQVLRRRFGLGGPAELLHEIGQSLGVTKEAVRQIEKKALRQLRQLLGADDGAGQA